MCRVLGVSRAGYYAPRYRPPSEMKADNEKLASKIKEIHSESKGAYGSPRIHAELRVLGHEVNHKRVARLMAESGLQGAHKRRFQITTNSEHSRPVAQNLLDRQFQPAELNTAWASDITYIDTREGFLYLAVTMDLASRRIVGWAMDDHLRTELVERALVMALGHRDVAPDALHHSDRGCQYASHSFSRLLSSNGFTASMSRKGNCYDNAVMESFFATLKTDA